MSPCSNLNYVSELERTGRDFIALWSERSSFVTFLNNMNSGMFQRIKIRKCNWTKILQTIEKICVAFFFLTNFSRNCKCYSREESISITRKTRRSFSRNLILSFRIKCSKANLVVVCRPLPCRFTPCQSKLHSRATPTTTTTSISIGGR